MPAGTIGTMTEDAGAGVLPPWTAAAASQEMGRALASSDEEGAFRLVMELLDDLRAASPTVRSALVRERPDLVGDRRWDALVAALVEHLCARDAIPAPGWTSEPARFCQPLWQLSGMASLRSSAFVHSPISFLRHGVLVSESELERA